MQLDGLQKDAPQVEDRCLYKTAVSGCRDKKEGKKNLSNSVIITEIAEKKLMIDHIKSSRQVKQEKDNIFFLVHQLKNVIVNLGNSTSTANVFWSSKIKPQYKKCFI